MLGLYPFPSWSKPLLYALVAAGGWMLRRRRAALAFVVVFAAGHPILLYLISLHRPVFYFRPMLWTTPLGFLLMGFAIARLVSPLGTRAVVASTAIAAFVQFTTTAHMYPPSHEHLDSAAFVEPLREFRNGRDALLIAPLAYGFQLGYELRGLGLQRPWIGLAFGDKPEPLVEWYGVRQVSRDQLPTSVSPFERVWLMREVHHRFPPAVGDGFERVVPLLEAWGDREGSWAAGNVELIRFKRRDPSPRPRAAGP